MAKPIEFRPAADNPRDEIQRRLADAPIEHAEALLACYKLIEEAHRSGTLELLRGLLGAQDAVVSHLSQVLATPETVSALRNGFILMKLLSGIDSEKLTAVVNGLAGAASHASTGPAPSIFGILGRATSEDGRRALSVGMAALEAAGKALRK